MHIQIYKNCILTEYEKQKETPIIDDYRDNSTCSAVIPSSWLTNVNKPTQHTETNQIYN